MKILLIGSGGREHALAWKLAQSSQVERIFVAPGNGGTASEEKCENVPIESGDLAGLRAFALQKRVDLTVVGPEAPLVAGIVDHFTQENLPVFGPCRQAARLEGSKAFSKEFMWRHGIPTGWAKSFDDAEAAMAFIETLSELPVIKASGLAAGKGVILPRNRVEAAHALREMLVDGRFGPAGETVVIEEWLKGPEMSVLAFCDGRALRIMPVAQDHKRLRDGDEGPNTGGMGAFVPSALATPELLEEVEHSVLRPALDGIAAEGAPYVGVLYAGLIITEDGPRVLEFNCRFGDPETQVIVPLLSTDLVEVMAACVEGRLDEVEPAWKDEAAVTVVVASGGYPGSYRTGKPIAGIASAEALNCTVFHAGTTSSQGELVTNGGRVLAVTATGRDLATAVARCYSGVEQIYFEDVYYRRDIGR